MRKFDYAPRNLGDIKELSNEEWLKWREHGSHYKDEKSPYYIKATVGGSDASTIFNVNRFCTSLELYHKKIGVTPAIATPKNNEILEAGHRFEPYVEMMFEKYMKEELKVKDFKIIEDTNMYQSGEIEYDEDGYPVIDMETGEEKLRYPFALADFDNRCLVNGKVCGAEYKTLSSSQYDIIKQWKDGICPLYYELQCRHYMAIANIDTWYICCCWGWTTKDMAVVKISRDKVLEETIMETEKQFVWCVENKVEPDISECNAVMLNDYYNRLYGIIPESKSVVEMNPDEYEPLIQEASSLASQIEKQEKQLKSLMNKREEIYAKFYAVFAGNNVGSCLVDDKLYYVKLHQSVGRDALDMEKLRSEQPDMCTKYTKSEEKFDSTQFKKENAVLYRQYLLPPAPPKTSTVRPYFEITEKEIPKKGEEIA